MTNFINNRMPKFWNKHFSISDGYGPDVFVLDPETVPGPLFTRFMAEDIRDLADAITYMQVRLGSLEGSGPNAPTIEATLGFKVDSTNANGFGESALTSNGYVTNVFMNTTSTPAGTPAFGTARTYGLLASTTITNTGSSVVTGNLGLYPGTAVTGFPPGTVTGTQNITNAAAQAAVASALASYNDLHSRSSSTIATALDGQTLTPGVYSSAGGTFTLAASGAGTLTLNGAGVYVFQTATTLTTGAGGLPTITLSGGAKAENVYWVVGSAATINQAVSAATGVFKGNIIAQTAITVTSGGTVNGTLASLTAAITLSAATNVNAVPLSAGFIGAGSPNPAPGYAVIQFNTNFNHYLGGFSAFVSPTTSSTLSVGGTALTVGQVYVIASIGTTTSTQWHTVGLPAGLTPAVGQSFVATASGSGGNGTVRGASVSGITSVEVVGDPNATLANTGGSYVLVQFLSNGVVTAPADGSLVNMTFAFN